jgi:serine/threonine protein kinase
MLDDFYNRVDRVLSEIASAPESEREQAVRRACGDDLALLEEVRSLLPAYRAVLESTLERPRGLGFTMVCANLPESDAGATTIQNQSRSLPFNLDQYEVYRELGAGGMGVVYLARHVLSRKKYAIKTIRRELTLTLHKTRLSSGESLHFSC